MPQMKKITSERSKLKERLAQGISNGVRASLDETRLSRSNFLGGLRENSALFIARGFRKKMLDRRRWKPLETMLAEDRLTELVSRELKRQMRAATDAAQFVLPGFEHLPRRIQVGRTSWPNLEQANVEQFLRFETRYQKRAVRNKLVSDELARLADLIRDQPRDLPVPQAVALATGDRQRQPEIPAARAGGKK